MDIPSLKVTALGRPGSGKTTFLVGMYADLSAGHDGYFLNATDPDVDLSLAEAWDRLLMDGELPAANAAENVHYPFVVLEGLNSLLEIDWLDYRGGALDDRTDSGEGDVPQLMDQISESDCVYFVVDGGYLAQPVTPGRRLGTLTKSGLKRMTWLYQDVVRRTESKPPIVLLITKADRIPAERRENLEELVDELRDLVPICFTEGVTTMVCPVMLGHFGDGSADKVEPGDIEPHGLQIPIIFVLAEYAWRVAQAAHLAERAANADKEQLRTEQAALANDGLAILKFGQRGRVNDRIAQTDDRIRQLNALASEMGKLADVFFGELSDYPILRDGALQ